MAIADRSFEALKRFDAVIVSRQPFEDLTDDAANRILETGRETVHVL